MAYSAVSDDQAYHRLEGDGTAPGSIHLLLKDDADVGDVPVPLPDGYPHRRGWWPLLVACAPCFGSCRGLVARAAVGWLTPSVWKAFRGEPVESSAFVDESQSSLTDSLRLWQLLRVAAASAASRGPADRQPLGRCAWAFARGRITAACLLGAVGALGSVASPVLLVAALISAMDDSPADQVPAVLWATGFALCELLNCLLTAGSSSIATREAGRLRAALQGLLFRKMIRINSCCGMTPDQAESLVVSGATPLWKAVEHAPQLVVAPLLVVLGVAASSVLVGRAAVVAAVAYLLAASVQVVVTGLSVRLRARAETAYARWRRRRTFELLSLAAHAKTFIVESALMRRIRELRRMESASLRLASTLDSLCRSLLPTTVPVVTVALALHPYLGRGREHPTSTPPTRLYPVLILLLVQMECALRRWGQAVQVLIAARGCLGKLQAVLSLEEAKPQPGQPIDRLVAVSFNNASFAWGSSSTPSSASPARASAGTGVTLQTSDVRSSASLEVTGPKTNVLTAIHMVVNKGRLVGVCGREGAGKSALLLAASGQLHLTAGQLHRGESAAYVGAAAAGHDGLLPGSVRDNVVHGAHGVHGQRYYRALHCSGLERDLQALPLNDQTTVDATRMSAALLQRLALARAVYADRDVYLLDDPLSALDSAAADLVFAATVLDVLKEKTVVLATNREQHLRHCSEVFVLRGGRVVERGTPQELAESGREYAQVLDPNSREEQWWTTPCSCEVTRTLERPRDNDDEDVAGTGVRSELRAVAEECGVSLGRLALLSVPMLLQSALYAIMMLCFWLALLRPRPPMLTVGFMLAASLVVALTFLKTFTVTQALLGQSRRLHDRWLSRLGCATVDFLRSHAPALRQAMARHTWLPDAGLARALVGLAEWTPLVLAEMALLGLASRWAAAAVLGLLLPGALLLTYVTSVACVRMWRRERASRASLGQLVASSFCSRASLLSLGLEDDLLVRFAATCDRDASDLVHAESLPAWLAVRLRAGVVVAGLVTLVAQVWTLAAPAAPITPAVVAVSTSSTGAPFVDQDAVDGESGAALGVSALLLCLIAAHLPRAAVAAIRARSHLADVVEARDLINRAEVEDEALCAEGADERYNPALCWPGLTDVGGLVLRDVWRPPELRALNARVGLGECVGVLGPPSAALAAALLRFLRPTAGCVLISGADIADLALPLLRNAVVVVPPRPTVFRGTLRWNLDPHGVWSDAQLWEALERTGSGLVELVASLESKLLTSLGGPTGMAVGPEDLQLLCLARATLRSCVKVVLLEAPAGPRVLSAARKLFPQCPILVAGRGPADVAQCTNVLQFPL